MTDEQRAAHLWNGLNDCARIERGITVATVTHWLEYHGAGFPDVPLMQERVRDDAKLWAASASQAELEAYVAAGIMELEKSLLTARALKRLAALAWKNMSAEDRSKFKEWIEQQ